MELARVIEKYVGREVDFTNEVILIDNADGKGSFIYKWNILEKPKPTKEQLNTAWISNELQIAKDIKEAELKRNIKSDYVDRLVEEDNEYITKKMEIDAANTINDVEAIEI